MNEIDHLKNLAAAARTCTPPPVDTADRIMATIRNRQPAPIKIYAALTTISSLAAAIIAAWGIHTWLSLTDPINEMASLTNLFNT